MPFPLAHPAAVLPLRRWSIRYLSFVALLLGTITPDLSYCLEQYKVDVLAHSLRGCVIFSLPVGWILVLISFRVGEPLVGLLPAPHRQVLLPACCHRRQPWFAVPLSVLIGAMTHVFWDSFTHDTGWFVERSDFLQSTLFAWNGHSFQMYRLVWHVSTWVGLLLLYRAYADHLKKCAPTADLLSTDEKQRYVLWASLLLLPLVGAMPIAILSQTKRLWSVAALPQFLRFSAAVYLVMLSALLIALGVSVKVRRHR